MAEWFRHDVHAARDEKCARLIELHGAAGYGIWWLIIEFLATCEKQRYPKNLLCKCIASAYANALQVFDDLFVLQLLHIEDEKYAYSRSLRERLKAIENIGKKRKEAARKRWDSEKNQVYTVDANALQMQSKCNATVNANAMRYDLSRSDKSRVEKSGYDVAVNGSHAPSPDLIYKDLGTEDSKIAESKLETPGLGAPWEKTNLFILAGRRPLKTYPDIFMSMPELAEAISQWRQGGIPEHRYRDVLEIINGKLKTLKAKQQNIESVSAFNWAIGWAKIEVIQSINEETKLSKNKSR